MRRLRVMVVDDSVVVRRLVGQLISADDELELAAVARDGRVALNKLAEVAPDVVILDVEMPELDGLATLRLMRERDKSLPVLVFSALTERAGELTLDALALGAGDYVTKPTTMGSAVVSLHEVGNELLAKVKALGRGRGGAEWKGAALPPIARPVGAERLFPPVAVELLAIGASTGGPNAVEAILEVLPAAFPVPIVLVQHMPALFTPLFAARLDQRTQLRVREAVPGAVVRAGEVWVAPGDFHLTVRRAPGGLQLQLDQGLPENSCRPSADALFRSAAAACGPGVLGLVLTGMGSDGLRGCGLIRAGGGRVLVQDETTSVVWGMPGSVARAGLADAVLPLERIPEALLERTLGGAWTVAGLPEARA